VSNTLYYSLTAGGSTELKAWLLGSAAGWGAVKLPSHIGLDPSNSNRTEATRFLTVGLYLIGGLTAASTVRWLNKITK
jgi:hypothetical protein